MGLGGLGRQTVGRHRRHGGCDAIAHLDDDRSVGNVSRRQRLDIAAGVGIPDLIEQRDQPVALVAQGGNVVLENLKVLDLHFHSRDGGPAVVCAVGVVSYLLPGLRVDGILQNL